MGSEDRASIRGRVVGADGRPIADATVMITRGPRHPDIAALTDQDGLFGFTDLGPGLYELLANAEHQAPVRTTVRVAAGEATRAEIRFES